MSVEKISLFIFLSHILVYVFLFLCVNFSSSWNGYKESYVYLRNLFMISILLISCPFYMILPPLIVEGSLIFNLATLNFVPGLFLLLYVSGELKNERTN